MSEPTPPPPAPSASPELRGDATDRGTLATLFSLPNHLECDGKVYPIRDPSQLEQGQYQRWLEDRAYDAVERREWKDEDTKARAISQVARDAAAGVYEYGGEVANKSLLTESGATKILSIICNVSEEEAREVIKLHKRRVDAIFTAAMTNDPKALAAALQTLELPSEILSDAYATRRLIRRKKKRRG